jgi:NTE family protein
VIGIDSWPQRDLQIVAVSASTGEPVVWDRRSGVPIVAAVAASSAFPGASPPIQIGSDSYIDGGLRAGANADLADSFEIVVVIEPLAHLFRGETRPEEGTQPQGRLSVVPEAASMRAFGSDLYEPASWSPAYSAGCDQGLAIAPRLRTLWASA